MIHLADLPYAPSVELCMVPPLILFALTQDCLLQEQDLPQAPSARPGHTVPAQGEDEFGLPAVPQRT